MAITINGSGTITGVSAGGLPDGSVTADDLASTLDISGKTVTLPSDVGGITTGKVLQVVQGSTSTQVSTSAQTYIDTGLTATITPSSTSNKILVLVAHNDVRVSTTQTILRIRLLVDGTQIYLPFYNALLNAGGNMHGAAIFNYLHSPSSTSALTYKTQFYGGTGGTTYIQADNSSATITLMEIAG